MGPAQRVRLLSASDARFAIACAAVTAGVVLLGALWVGRREAAPVQDPIDVVRIGVVQGQTVPGYLDSSRTELGALAEPSAPAAGDMWALVSFGSYVPAGRLPGLLEGASVAQVYARVPMPGQHTQVVRIPVYRLPADVLTGMLDAAIARDTEKAAYEQLASKLPAAEARARDAYAAAAHTAEVEAAAYRSGCSCVFAAVVRGTPAALQQVAARPGVRAVDAAPEVRSLDRTEFRPPLPEQTGVVPAVPTAAAGIASQPSAPIVSAPGVDVTSASSRDSGHLNDPSASASEDLPAVPSASDATAAHDATSASAAAP
ncbi:hypothetical protein [Paractinoplanes atraurantiacus]|uniref:Uncharacterized protein n=1 Tax=Paractinoplanes atraurantiacus TaxID=1036182 RepID=A0A285ITE8_9ACTN|nr:hypothetical protein [Actinoplanes atraurantiacus]SNY51103.1 hypothetical protein SAMN05421748_111188 [Actinoplanes atraurantiacus]